MLKLTLITCSLLLLFPSLIAQKINPEAITIVRDSFGVPHIYAPTDEEMAYGFAWATAEDDFKTMQHQLLAIRGQMGAVEGIKGALLDVVAHLAEVHKVVDKRYDVDLSPKFRIYLDGFAQGANAYAASHPKEVLRKGLFPIDGKDIIKGYVLGLFFITSVHEPLQHILEGRIANYEKANIASGSNCIAVSPNRTTDGKSYLAVNSHQPLEGLYSWYEAHLNSDEGFNMLGAGFPGSATLFIGANEYLGWGHTLNYPDLSDVYKLTMHPSKKNQYQLDDKWLSLEKYPVKFKVKVLGFLRIPVKKNFYKSQHGIVIKTRKKQYYAIRFPANRDIRAAEQWYRMCRAQNFEEFRTALNMHALPGINLAYADREGNIYYLSTGHFPYRQAGYDWQEVLPGNKSELIWQERNYHPIDSLPQVLNPDCGYVYTTNQPPFNSTSPEENPRAADFDSTMGFQTLDNNRSIRLLNLMEEKSRISFEDFTRIKYDLKYDDTIYHANAVNLDEITRLDPAKYPKLSKSITLLNDWDHSTDTASLGATLFVLSVKHIFKRLAKEDRMRDGNRLSEEEIVEGLSKAQRHLKKYFGTETVPLGSLQRHVRGDISLAVSGGPEILAAMHTRKWKKGMYHSWVGESYIQMVRFDKNGVELETINAYGASAKEGNVHYTDQMQLFVKQKLKPMTLDKDQVFLQAEKIYHPK